MSDPFITAICPTYLRPRLLQNAVACWQAQRYSIHRCELVIFDDADQYPKFQMSMFRDTPDGKIHDCPPYRLISEPNRYPSLPDKFNRILELIDPRTEAIVVWEDDDVYLPNHLQVYANGFRNHMAVKPTFVYSTYGCPVGKLQMERSTGRFHASLGVRTELLNQIGGWPKTKRADFDQQMLKAVETAAGSSVYKAEDYDPTYVFRWQNTGHPHGQHFMQGPDDSSWYDRAAGRGDPTSYKSGIEPRMDDETKMLYEAYAVTSK